VFDSHPAYHLSLGTSMTESKIKVEFAPGCFDSFDGTQEELNELVAEIQRMAKSGEMFEKSTPLTEDSFNELNNEEQQALLDAVKMFSCDIDIRNLQ
jgi:hypothetical protein